jgi:hypothetical protein
MEHTPVNSIIDEARAYLNSIHHGENTASPYQRIRDLVVMAKSIIECNAVKEGSCNESSQVLDDVLKMSESMQNAILQESASGTLKALSG